MITIYRFIAFSTFFLNLVQICEVSGGYRWVLRSEGGGVPRGSVRCKRLGMQWDVVDSLPPPIPLTHAGESFRGHWSRC